MVIPPLSSILQDLNILSDKETLRINDLLNLLHERGFGIIIFLFALPAALPLPAVGVGTILGLPLLLLTAQQACGCRSPWLPQFMIKKTVSQDTVQAIVTRAVPWIEKIEILTRPRLGFITSRMGNHIIGVMGFIMALCVCLPFPLTNTVPSLGIAVMAVGTISRDGLAVIAGALIGLLWVAMLAIGVTLLGPAAFEVIKETIKSFI